jgi:hypothetical protein
MKHKQNNRTLIINSIPVILIAILSMSVLGQTGGNKAADPSIQITVIPPRGAGPDKMEAIAGTVSGVNAKECKVIIFALGGDTWYVQPFEASPDTLIGADNKWETDTHLGSQYAALLVKSSYKPPAKTGTLPKLGGPVLALVRVPAKRE